VFVGSPKSGLFKVGFDAGFEDGFKVVFQVVKTT
jgi:hypothetical protein